MLQRKEIIHPRPQIPRLVRETVASPLGRAEIGQTTQPWRPKSPAGSRETVHVRSDISVTGNIVSLIDIKRRLVLNYNVIIENHTSANPDKNRQQDILRSIQTLLASERVRDCWHVPRSRDDESKCVF